MSSELVRKVKMLLADGSQEMADVSAMEVRGIFSEIMRLESQLDPAKLENPVSYYTMHAEYMQRVLIEDWEIFGGCLQSDWEAIQKHKNRIEKLLNG